MPAPARTAPRGERGESDKLLERVLAWIRSRPDEGLDPSALLCCLARLPPASGQSLVRTQTRTRAPWTHSLSRQQTCATSKPAETTLASSSNNTATSRRA